VPTDELMKLIRLWALERWPRRPVQRVTVELADGDKVKMPMPDCPYQPAGAAPNRQVGGASVASDGLYRYQRRILETVAGMETEEPTAELILAALGWKDVNANGIRKMLASMRKQGLLGGATGKDAYPLTAKGAAAVEPP
jgi:hypothetical protein